MRAKYMVFPFFRECDGKIVRGVLAAADKSIQGQFRAESRERGASGERNTPTPGGSGGNSSPARGVAESRSYLMRDVIWKIGRYSATIIPPTTTPRNAMSNGSMRAVRDSVVASTSAS